MESGSKVANRMVLLLCHQILLGILQKLSDSRLSLPETCEKMSSSTDKVHFQTRKYQLLQFH